MPPKGRYWGFSEKRVKEWYESGKLVFPNKKNKNFYIKKYKKDLKSLTLTHSTIFEDVLTMHGTKEIRAIMDKNLFLFPKPVKLIKFLINLIYKEKKEFLILDFFADSGTTGQAVMELNKEDGGNRRFILITNNENDIARKITRERLFRVINGEGSNGEQIQWMYDKKNKIKSLTNNSVRYLELEQVDKVNGEFEQIDSKKELYKQEFNKNISIEDFE